MKHTLGKIIVLLCLGCFISSLHATNLATYKLSSSNNKPYLKEAIKLSFVAQQKDHSHVMYFFLTPKESKDYKITLLNKAEEDDKYHDKQTTYTYLLFPLKTGTVHVDFDYTIKIASDDAVAEVFKGSRDNVKWIVTKDTKVAIKPLTLEIQKLKTEVALVGDFTLSSTLKSNKIEAYESANITYNVQGNGYDDMNLSFVDTIPNVKIFSDVIKHKNKASSKGFKIQREFNYAFVSDTNFTIPSKKIKCFSPSSKLYYTLKSKAYDVTVTAKKKSLLLDKEDYPSRDNSFASLAQYGIYLLIFLSGFISAKILPNRLAFSYKTKQYRDIEECKTSRTLLTLLLSNYDKVLLKEEIELLEDILYHNAKHNFKKIKETSLLKLKSLK